MTATMTLTPRRTRPAVGRLLGPLVLAALLALTGCSGAGDDEPDTAASAASPSGTTTGDPAVEADEEPADTYTGSPVPATVEVPVKDLPGFEEIRFWKSDDELLEGPRQVTGGLVVDEGELAVLVASTEALITEETVEAEMRDWRRHNGFTDALPELLDPVVVDGEEVLHARGKSGLQQYDLFLKLADNGDALRFVFSTPLALTEAEREDYIASVLATVEFE